MIVTIGGIKGGCGKSLISTNMVVLRSFKKKKVLFVDADEQGTASDWTSQRISLGIKTPWTTVQLKSHAVKNEIRKLQHNYDDVIIDCGGRDTASLRAALIVSDLFIIPFQPRCFDIWTVQKVSDLVEEASSINEKLKAYTVINCASSRGTDNVEAQSILSQSQNLRLIPATIGLRKAFSNATAEGKGIIETKNDEKAEEEMIVLHNIIFSIK